MGIEGSVDPERRPARLWVGGTLERTPRRTETRFERLADAVEDHAMFLLDETGRVRTWNAGGERITGYASDEIVGEHVSVLYRDEDVEAGVPDRILREAAAEGHVEDEGWRVRRDGSEFRAAVTTVALHGDRPRDGKREDDRVGYAKVARDITRRDREAALVERTERLEDLVATVSHDLRNPLSVAEGNVELAAETGDLSRLEAATRALDRATELLDHLANLAEEDSTIGEPEPVDLRGVVRAAWGSVETDGATLDVRGGATTLADRRRLQQLVENLFANAVEHAGPDVTVSVGPLEEAGTGPESGFFVEDDGPGIPEAERTEVFEMGYTTDPEGTGFGLAICRRIADAHGWSIDVVDGTDGGARFEVSVVDGAR